MYRVFGLRLGPNFGVRPVASKTTFFLSLKKNLRSRFLPRNICGHMAEMAAVLQMRLTTQIQKLKYKVTSLNFMRIFVTLPNFLFISSETKHDHIRVIIYTSRLTSSLLPKNC